MSKEERFAQVVKRDLANRPQMMRQEEAFDVDSYTNKTALQSITDLAKKTADKILGLEPGFVRIEKSQRETSKAFVKITESLTDVKNTFVKTSDNFKEFVDSKEEVIKIKTKIREVLRKEQDENKTNAAEKQLEMFNDTAGTTDVAETDQGLDDGEEQQEEDGGFDLPDFRRLRLRGRLRLLRRKLGKFGRGIRGRLGGLGKNIRGFGGRIAGGLKGLGGGITSKGGGLLRGLGSGIVKGGGGLLRGLGGLAKGLGGRFLGPILGDMLFPAGTQQYDQLTGPNAYYNAPNYTGPSPTGVEKKPETKLSGGGIVAGEAGNEAVIPLTSSIGKKVTGGLEENNSASTLSAIGPLLSATAGIVRNPLYGSILGPVVNPIIQPMLAQYKVPVYSGDFGSFKISKLQAATTQAKGKTKSIEQASKNPLTSGMGWLGNMFSGIGGMVSGAFGGIKNFFGGLFGGRRRRNGGGSPPPPGGLLPGNAPPEIKAMLEAISAGEGSWNSVNSGLTIDGLSNMTIAEARETGMKIRREGKGSGALGKWQQMPIINGSNTLKERAEAAGLNYNTDKFSPENQTKIARKYMSDVYGGEQKLLTDLKRDPLIAARKLNGVWPSLPGGSQQNQDSQTFLKHFKAASQKYGSKAREEQRVRDLNPQSRGMQGPTAPGAVGTGNGQQVSTTGSRNLGSDAKNTASAAAAPKVSAEPKAKSDDSSLMASASQLSSKSLAPSVMQDPNPDNEGYGNNLAIVAPPAGNASPQIPRQTGGGGFVVMDQDPGLTIGGIINARLYNA
jgi:muramidase (phage lysozyme)